MKVYNLIIVDQSGSMACMHREAVTGLNETIQSIKVSQKKSEGKNQDFVTLVFFDSSEIKTIYDRKLAEDVKEISMNDFCPNACTPLYDAIGKSVTELRKYVETGDKVIVTIITDGYENASMEFTGSQIAQLIESLKKEDWLFTYIGANQDVEKVAAQMNILNSLQFDQTEKGSTEMFRKFRRSRSKMYDQINDMAMGSFGYSSNFFSSDNDEDEDDDQDDTDYTK